METIREQVKIKQIPKWNLYSSYVLKFIGRGFMDAESLHEFKTHRKTCHSLLNLELSFLIQKVPESHITGGLGECSWK